MHLCAGNNRQQWNDERQLKPDRSRAALRRLTEATPAVTRRRFCKRTRSATGGKRTPVAVRFTSPAAQSAAWNEPNLPSAARTSVTASACYEMLPWACAPVDPSKEQYNEK